MTTAQGIREDPFSESPTNRSEALRHTVEQTTSENILAERDSQSFWTAPKTVDA
jgi:hypothetical protein